MGYSEEQMQRTWENRRRRSGRRRALPEPAGEVARAWMDRRAGASTALQSRLREVMLEGGAEEVLAHAVPLEVRGGVLMLGVTSAAAAYHLRSQWGERLRELCQVRLPEAGIHAVRFVTDPV